MWPVLAGVLVIHALITTVFVAVPGLLVDAAALPLASHWRVYLPAFAAGPGGADRAAGVPGRTARCGRARNAWRSRSPLPGSPSPRWEPVTR